MRSAAILLSAALFLVLSGCLSSDSRPSSSQGSVNVTIPATPADLSKTAQELKSEVQASNNNTQAHMDGLMNTNISKLAEKMDGIDSTIKSLSGQIGIGNRLDQIETHLTQSAGRDINYMPKETVWLVLGLTTGLFALLAVAIIVMGNNARLREQERTAEEEENTKMWQSVALQAIAGLEPEKAKAFANPETLYPRKH